MSDQPAWIQASRDVIAHNSFRTVDIDTGKVVKTKWEGDEVTNGVVLDLITAGMLVGVYDALGEANRAKFGSMSLLQAVNVGWRLVERSKAKR
jgi:hypothetical protein